MARNTTVDHVEAAIYHLAAIMDPAACAMAETPASQRAEETGHEPRKHAGFRFLLQGVCNSIQHQLTGQMAGSFRNATKAATDSLQAYRDLQNKYSDPATGLVDDTRVIIDPAYGRISAWLDANLKSEDSYNKLMVVFASLYERYVGVTVKPVTFQPKEDTVMKAALTEAAKKAALAKKAELDARVAA
jgi:hypothetical protein